VLQNIYIVTIYGMPVHHHLPNGMSKNNCVQCVLSGNKKSPQLQKLTTGFV